MQHRLSSRTSTATLAPLMRRFLSVTWDGCHLKNHSPMLCAGGIGAVLLRRLESVLLSQQSSPLRIRTLVLALLMGSFLPSHASSARLAASLVRASSKTAWKNYGKGGGGGGGRGGCRGAEGGRRRRARGDGEERNKRKKFKRHEFLHTQSLHTSADLAH